MALGDKEKDDFVKALSGMIDSGHFSELTSTFRLPTEESPFKTTPVSAHAATGTTKPFSLADATKSPVTKPSPAMKKLAMERTFEAVWKAGNMRKDLELIDNPMRSRGRAIPEWWAGPRGEELTNILHRVNFRRAVFGYSNHWRYQEAMQDLGHNWTPELHLEMLDHLTTITGLEIGRHEVVAREFEDLCIREEKKKAVAFKPAPLPAEPAARTRSPSASWGVGPAEPAPVSITPSVWTYELGDGSTVKMGAAKPSAPTPPAVKHDPIDALPDDLLTELANEGVGTPAGTW